MCILGVSLSAKAQIPQTINYQAVARYTNSNLPIPHQPVTVNFKIRQGGILGSLLFDETHLDSTDDCGLFNLKIGSVKPAAFKQIDWSTGNKFLEVNINGVISGVSELTSTPYSLYADYAKSSLDWKNIGDSLLYSKGKKIGIGTVNPESDLDVYGQIRVKGGDDKIRLDASSATADNHIMSFDENGERLWVLNLADRSVQNRFGLYSEKIQKYVFNVSTDGNVGIQRHASPNYALAVDGSIYANGSGSLECLTIRGGCDWYEEANATEVIQPGHVVVIDSDESVNSVKLSSIAYDRLVTGVVSGAGGVNPGIGLKQSGMLEGNTKVAMGGKVKVIVTGIVKPGDLLTSSNKAGYAMAVKSRKKAFGSVLGKALSKPDNEGLVLMQVMMQ